MQTGLVHDPLMQAPFEQPEVHAIGMKGPLSEEYSTEPIQPFVVGPRRRRLEKLL